ncbi:hypothetical protein HQ520_12190 [bacterium]|nr:hypothetical protein [bacterium]
MRDDTHTGTLGSKSGNFLLFLGTILSLCASQAHALPDLIPYQPVGWSAAIVVSTVTDTDQDSSSLSDTQTLYLDWAVLNDGTTTATEQFQVDLYVDATRRTGWNVSSLTNGFFVAVRDYSLGTLAAGPHTLRLVVDAQESIGEDDETNNEFTKNIAVIETAPNLLPHKPTDWSNPLVISGRPGGNTQANVLLTSETVHLDFAVVNLGTTPTLTGFDVVVNVNGSEALRHERSEPLTDGFFFRSEDNALSPLAAGEYTFELVVDADGEISESNEDDNTFSRTITVYELPGSDLVPYGHAGRVTPMTVSRTAGTNQEDTDLTAVETIYLDWAVINRGNADTQASFRTTLFVDGEQVKQWVTIPPVQPSFFVKIEDAQIGPLAAGSHELTLTADSPGEETELEEDNNSYTKTIQIKSGTTAARDWEHYR